LGYVVQGGARNTRNAARFMFIIQSANHPSDVLMKKSDAFLQDFLKTSDELIEANFKQNVEGLITSLRNRPKDMEGRFADFATLMKDRSANWKYYDEIIEQLEKIDKDQLKTFAKKVLNPMTQPRLTLYYYAKGKPQPHQATGEVTIKTRADLDRKTSAALSSNVQ
jgi:secreted Zn-dependent insulinase-like peptidase